MICLVTGATGFIGSHICRELLADGHEVRAFCRPNSTLHALEGLDVDYFIGDILESETLSPAMRGADWVFHTAARAAHWHDDPLLIPSIVEGTRHVLREAYAAGVQRVIYTSSVAALGIPKRRMVINEEHQLELTPGQWPYGYAKREAEKEVNLATREGLDCVTLNPTTILGPGDLNAVSGSLIIDVARGKIRILTQGGMNVVHVNDVAAGHLAAARIGRSGHKYILGGHNLTHVELVRMIASECHVPAPSVVIPPTLIRLAASSLAMRIPLVRFPYNANMLRLSTYYFYYDTRKSHRELQLPDPLPITQTISETVSWYSENNYLNPERQPDTPVPATTI